MLECGVAATDRRTAIVAIGAGTLLARADEVMQ
jgi:hypothetical protein